MSQIVNIQNIDPQTFELQTYSVSDISLIEDKFGRKAVEGNRRKPDGTELRWKQIGVNEITEEKDLPFFIANFLSKNTFRTILSNSSS